MSMMYCFECDRAIDTDYFMNGHQFEPDFKCEDCVEKLTPMQMLTLSVEENVKLIDRMRGEIDDLRHERDMYWEYWLAANDLHHLEESLGAGVPIPNGSRDKAVESINMIRSRIEEWQNDL